MTSIKIEHFNLNRILLLAIGLWPYQRTKLVQFQLIVFFSILTSFIVIQSTIFLTEECTPGFVLKMLSFIMLFIVNAIEYNSFWINIQTVRYLLEQLQHIYNNLRDENEIAIVEKYENNTKRYTIKIVVIAMCGMFGAVFLQIWLYVHNIVMSTNESGPHLPIQYFVDQEKYYLLSLLHMNVAAGIGSIAFTAIGTMLIGYVKHACGMFRIASYRIEQAMAINHLQDSIENEIMIYKKIIYAVDIHCKAIQFLNSLASSFEGSLFFLIAATVCCLSLNLFNIANILSKREDRDHLLLHLIIVVFIVLYMFLSQYAGQEIIDHNDQVFSTVYNIHWYAAPLHIQKVILFLLQRGTKIFTFNVGGVFVLSLKCFASLASASISYFTVLYSTQQ